MRLTPKHRKTDDRSVDNPPNVVEFRAPDPVKTRTESRGENKELPHSADGEKGTLCSLLLSPRLIDVVFDRITTAYFHHPGRRLIAEALVELHYNGDLRGFEEIAPGDPTIFVKLTEALSTNGTIERVGGAAAISELTTFVPTATNWNYYVDLLREKYIQREFIRTTADLSSKAQSEHGDFTVFLQAARERIEVVYREADRGTDQIETYSPKDLAEFNTKEDPNALLGYRWLCRGGSCLWVGQAGLGKSSLMMQASINWALGQSLWGVAPKGGRELKSLIIQAENDKGDMAEMLQGVFKALRPPPGMSQEDMMRTINRNIVFTRDTMHTGSEFARVAGRLIDTHKPDLVWSDPLLSYVGDDISNQKVASTFLRNTLNPIAFNTGICWMLLHHTGKPSTDPKAKAHWTDHDFSYQAFGSSELVNWARAVNVLKPIGEGRFELRFAKRGKRSGLVEFESENDEDIESIPGEQTGAVDRRGTFTDVVYLKHAENAIYWEQIDRPAEMDEKPRNSRGSNTSGQFQEQFNAEDLVELIRSQNTGRKTGELQKWASEETGMSRATFYLLWKKVKSDTRLYEQKGRWYVRESVE